MKQLKISFYLIEFKKNKKDEAPIYARLKYKNQPDVNLSMQVYIKPDDWDNKKLKVKPKHSRAHIVNLQMKEMESKILAIYDELIYKGEEVSLKYIRDELRNKIQKKTIINLIDFSINAIASDPKYSKARVDHYKCIKNKLLNFLNAEYYVHDVRLGQLNYEFIARFDAFLSRERGNCANTIVHNIKTFKAIINRGRKMNWLNHNPFVNYKCKTEPSTREFLTVEEVNRIETLDLSNAKDAAKALTRDLFLFMIYTGVAYKDMTKLKESHITLTKGKRFIKFKREKTTRPCTIPLHPKAEALLHKYKEHPICQYSQSLLPKQNIKSMNPNLKIIARMTNIDKKLSTHIGRHTFATTSLEFGVPIETVSSALGHSSLKTTQIYAKITDDKIYKDYSNMMSFF